MEVSFNATHSYIDKTGGEHHFTTEVLPEGIRCISDGEEQGTYHPNFMADFVKSLEYSKTNEIIQSYTLGDIITVSNSKGYWEIINK